MKIPCRNKISGKRGFKARRSFGKVHFSQSPRPTRLAVHLFSAWGTQRTFSGGAHAGAVRGRAPVKQGRTRDGAATGTRRGRGCLSELPSAHPEIPSLRLSHPPVPFSSTGATPGVCPQRAASGGLRSLLQRRVSGGRSSSLAANIVCGGKTVLAQRIFTFVRLFGWRERDVLLCILSSLSFLHWQQQQY